MALTSNDTDVMRSSAGVFAETSENFAQESTNIKTTLSDISEALKTVTKNFSTHNGNVAGFSEALSQATQEMESVWESGAATAFHDSFTKFNKEMLNLSQMLQDISGDFSRVQEKIENIVNGNILPQVENYAKACMTDSKNLTTYANVEDENQERLKRAYGQ